MSKNKGYTPVIKRFKPIPLLVATGDALYEVADNGSVRPVTKLP